MNVQTFLLSVLIAGIVCAIIVKGVRNRKQGKSSCGCGCENCAGASTCHPPQSKI